MTVAIYRTVSQIKPGSHKAGITPPTNAQVADWAWHITYKLKSRGSEFPYNAHDLRRCRGSPRRHVSTCRRTIMRPGSVFQGVGLEEQK